MYYRPCVHCHDRAACKRRAAIKEASHELGLTSVRVKCDVPYQPFPPGTPVLFSPEWSAYSLRGTISRRKLSKPDKLVIWLDESPEDQPAQRLALAHPDELEPTGEPAVSVCPECGRPDGYSNSSDWWCPRCLDMNGKEA